MKKTCILLVLSSLIHYALHAQQLESNTDQAILYNTKGYEMLINGENTKARDFFLKAIKEDPANRTAYLNLMEVCRTLSDFKTLENQFEKAKKTFPDDDEIYYLSGNIHQNLRQFQKAIEDYSRAIQLSAQLEEGSVFTYAYHFNRGNSYLKLKQYANAVHDYDMTLALQPQNYAAFTNRGMARYQLKDRQGACEDWNKAQELGYEQVANYLNKFCQ